MAAFLRQSLIAIKVGVFAETTFRLTKTDGDLGRLEMAIMQLKNKLMTMATLCAAVGMYSGIANAEMTEAGKKAMQAAGKIMFEQRCESCHADDPARKAYGPSLLGVVGRKAGTLEGFEYSDAMKNSGIVWNLDALRAWMADNQDFMPGTRMRHVSIHDKAEQDFLLAYIKSLSEKAEK